MAFSAVGANGLDAVLDARHISAVGGEGQNLCRGGQISGISGESSPVVPYLARRPGDAGHGPVLESALDFTRGLGDVLGRPLDLAHGSDSAAGLKGNFDALETAEVATHELFPSFDFWVLILEYLAQVVIESDATADETYGQDNQGEFFPHAGILHLSSATSKKRFYSPTLDCISVPLDKHSFEKDESAMNTEWPFQDR